MKKIIRHLIELKLTLFAKLILWRHKPEIIVVTGSAGKTTTKVAIGSVLREVYGKDVLVGYGNLGTISGIPLALLNFKVNILDSRWGSFYLVYLTFIAFFKTIFWLINPSYFKFIVLELTADLPGDLSYTSRYLKPRISIVTNVGQAHLEYFKDLDGVAEEKGSIIPNTLRNGLVILNKLDERVSKMKDLSPAKVVLVDVPSYEFASEVSTLVGRYFGADNKIIKNGLAKIIPPKSRFDILEGKNNTTIIDSTYNANPVSVKANLAQLGQARFSKQRKIVVLGDMLELGSEAGLYHSQIGQEAKKVADILIAFGPVSSRNMPADFKTNSIYEAYQYIIKIMKPDDLIFIKASHGMKLGGLVQKLVI